MEQPSHGDQLSQILAKLTEQSERMNRQEQFVIQQNEPIAIQTETLEWLQKENQELHQKINVIADKHPENEDEREEDIPHDSGSGGKKDAEHNNSCHDAGSEEEESTKASTYTGDTRVTETEFLKKKIQRCCKYPESESHLSLLDWGITLTALLLIKLL